MADASQQVVLLRHGETEWSRAGRHTGRTDIPLTDLGRRQARMAAPRLAAYHFDAVLVSPLVRAHETAVLAGLGPLLTRDALMEWDYGEDEGITTAEIRIRRPGWVLWDDGCPGGEDAAAVGARVDPVVGEARDAAGDVAIVAHGHLLRILAARWLGMSAATARHLRLDTGAVSILGYEHTDSVIRLWNDGSHLGQG